VSVSEDVSVVQVAQSQSLNNEFTKNELHIETLPIELHPRTSLKVGHKFACTVTKCTRSGKEERQLNGHMEHHSQPLPDPKTIFLCETCGYYVFNSTTANKGNLNKHILACHQSTVEQARE
jgi:hypothetical protein